MGSGIYSIGVSALQNAQLGLATTSHNIANANTDGYNRQRIIQTTNTATLTGAGYVGQGAHVSTIERIYNSYLSRQVTTAQSSVSQLEATAASLGELNGLLSDDDAGLASALEAFFKGVNQVSSDPASLTTRQSMVSAAQALVSRFHELDAQLDAQYRGINGQVQTYVGTINSYSQQVADLNQRIIVAQSTSTIVPNDLYDQRDQVVAELNKLIGVQTTINSNGSYNVYFGNGQQLVVGAVATTLSAVTSSEDSSRLTVAIVNPAGTQELPESVISGGALAGVLEYRAETLDGAANALGRISASLALTFNAQHALGQDLLGNIAGDAGFVADFFDIGDPSVIANANNATGSATVTASYSAPSLASDGTFYTRLTASDYRLEYDGTNFTLTRLSDDTSWSAASIGALNTAVAASTDGPQGFTLASSGTFSAGSTYLIEPTRYAAQTHEVNATVASDVRQIAAAAPVRASVGTANTGSGTISAGSVATGYTAPAVGSPITLTYNSTTGGFTGFPAYPVTATVNGVTTSYASGTVPFTNGATYTFSGISVTVGGAPRNGDTFVIARNANGVSDNRNALLLAAMQSGKTMAGNTASYSTVYAQLVADAGNQGSRAQTVLAAQTSLLEEAQNARDAVSGVNLDEEAVKLVEYQEAYQASAKMLQIASELFDSILAIG